MEKRNLKNIENEIKKIIFQFLNSMEYEVFIFGTRATGKADTFSDYDIGIKGKKPAHMFELIWYCHCRRI